MTNDISLIRLIEAMNERPIAFNRHYVALGCGITGAVMLSQMVYWSRHSKNDGWFYKTQDQWEEEIGLTRSEQETARKKLRDLGFLVEQKKGVPCRVHFKVDLEKLYKALMDLASKPHESEQKTDSDSDDSECGNPANQYAGFQQTEMQDSSILDCGEPANSDAGIQQTITENTQRVHQKNKNTFSDDFEKFWSVFPSCQRKTKKSEAFKTFEKHKSNFDLGLLLSILELQKKSDDWIKNDGQFIPAPVAWLNQRQWENEFWMNRINQNQNTSNTADQQSQQVQPQRFTPQPKRFGQGLI